jgi:hypothetical protein
MHFSHRGVPLDAHLTFNARKITVVNYVKYPGVIFVERITWRMHVEMIPAKGFRSFIRAYPLFENRQLNTNIKLTLRKAFIMQVMT